MPAPDFIGLGAQKAGTSWIYACMYEHPQICIPQKELHFFSRERNWSRGCEWYEQQFAACDTAKVKGEFSTSYLYDPESADRIQHAYPMVKLIACLRNPVDRAVSNYVNDIKAGSVPPSIPFTAALAEHPEYLQQGRYAAQLQRYLARFSADRILLLVYEDIRRDPLLFMQSIYRFLGVDPSFRPSHLNSQVNVGHVPRFVPVEKALNTTAGMLRRSGYGRLVWLVKKSGIPNRVRAFNRRRAAKERIEVSPEDRQQCYLQVRADILELEALLGRSLPWHLP